MNKTQSLVFIISILLSTSTIASSKWSGDWFEIEVILLTQLDDKSTLTEIFPDVAPLTQHKKTLDLLAKYLQPNIFSLKQQLPLCDDPHYPESLLQQRSKLPDVHPILALTEIKSLPSQFPVEDTLFTESPYGTEVASNFIEDRAIDNTSAKSSQPNNISVDSQELQKASPIKDDFFDRVQTQQEKQIQPFENENSQNQNNQNLKAQESLNTQVDLLSTDLTNRQQLEGVENQTFEEISPITEQQLALVEEAKTAFSDIQFSFRPFYEETDISDICRISAEQFTQINSDDTRYSYNGFSVAQMPTTINGIEDLTNEHPYLLSSDSLQLKDIYRQLRRSKDFRPMLHLAWRQPVYEQERSTPIKLYAGENLQDLFERSNAQYQNEITQEIEHEKAIANMLNQAKNNGSNIDSETVSATQLAINIPNKSQLIEQTKQQKITDIITTFDQVNDMKQVIDSIRNSQSIKSGETNDSVTDLVTKAPLPPIQPWFIDGLLDVYLKGVYLNVAAEINILNLTVAEQETLKLRSNSPIKVKSIQLNQHRRLISNEIHYFDHPYIGMIVQIRRHQRPEPLNIEDDNIINQ